MVRIRRNKLHILTPCWKTVRLTISLSILVEFGCSSIFWNFWLVLVKNTMKKRVWSSDCLALFQMVFGAKLNQSERAIASNWSDAVLANSISITKLPLAYLINILFHFLFLFLFHFDAWTYKIHNSLIFHPNRVRFFSWCSSWCVEFYNDFCDFCARLKN